MLDYKGKFCPELLEAFTAQGYTINPNGFEGLIYNEAAMQAIIDSFEMPMPDITPFQFLYMLGIARIDVAVDQLLPNIRNANLQLYSQIQGKLKGSGWFEWDKSLAMLQQLKPSLLQIDPTLDLSVAALKQRWLEASKVKNT